MKSGRGGKRVGAGRPVQDEARGEMKKYTLFLYPDQWEKINKLGNRSEFVRQLIDNVNLV